MENSYKTSVLKLLKARNVTERSFEETIKYANKLLEKLDYLQKANAHKNFQTFVSDQDSPGVADHFGDPGQRANCENLQKSLAESHAKISKLAEQVINLKDTLDTKNLLVTKQSSELDKFQVELRSSQELVRNLKSELTCLKNALQSKSDDYTVLNISHSCIENKKNELEIENRKLRSQLSKYEGEREVFLRTESEKNFLQTENKKLKAQIEEFQELKERCLNVESQLNDLEIENKKLKSQITMLKETREHSLRSGSVESIGSADGGNSKKVARTAKVEGSLSSSRPSSSKTTHVHSKSPFPDKRTISFVAHDSEVNALMWYPDPTYLITAGADRRLKLWEISESDAKLLNSARDCNSSILSIDIDNKASTVLCASSDFSSRLWDISGFKLGHTLTGHSGKVMSAKFVKESDNIITGSLDKTVKLWGKNKTLCTLTFSSESPVNDVVSRDSSTIISGHADRKIRFWDIRAKKPTKTIDTSGAVTSLDVSKHLLLASEQGGGLKLFDLRTFKELMSMIEANFKIVCSWTRAKFSPDIKYCCCGSDNGSVFIWNCGTGALERELKGHDSTVISCSWSICGSYLATCETNRKCIIWSKLK
ncbi:autophagy-related protein 16-1-like [Argiope bruennichi]|uniref:Autophagy-related protein 16-1 like protein n=1 Tax=Argiope bruennichi TaxID=94029 RepID=A0A8T0ERL4_ARGBR|nr:autophagy-related protein 16-1-like [Argiope bruennichi]KAF8778573.1 Autophagy-related protein 16-1 like protein [Argiope bruennichi]